MVSPRSDSIPPLIKGESNIAAVIKAELVKAGIDLRNIDYNTPRGYLNGWDFIRENAFWTASSYDGLPLDMALELHRREYPSKGYRRKFDYGVMIVPGKNVHLANPVDFALPDKIVLDSLGRGHLGYEEVKQLYDSGELSSPRSVRNYHIHSQCGLRVFAKVVNSLLQ